MPNSRKVLIVEENSFIPFDVRVWYEVTTLRDAGWQVTVICPFMKGIQADSEAPDAMGEPEHLDGVTMYRFPLTMARRGVLSYLGEYLTAFVSIARLSWRAWRNGGFDIIHFCNPPDIFFPIAFFYRLMGASVVFDHHDLFPEYVTRRYRGLIGRLLYYLARVSEYLTFRSANTVISTNQSYAQVAMERGRIPADRVMVVRNGPKIDEFVPVEPDPALKGDFPHLACYAGAMGDEDGILDLLESIRHIVHDLGQRNVFFVLLGDGSARPHALANIAAWGLEDFVDMPGMIFDRLLLRRYLCTADVLLSPEPLTPLNTHSTFIKVGEYMAMGKPIVAYDLVETRYTAQGAAVYVEPGSFQKYGEAILELLEDPDLRQRMGESGRQRILNCLSWEQQQHNLFQAYEKALAQE